MASDDEPRLVWYCLKTPIGDTYPETSADYVLLPNVYVIAQFRDAVLAKNDRIIGHAVPSMLTVYKNEASLDAALAAKNKPDSKDKEEGPLDVDLCIVGLGVKLMNALMVVVPHVPDAEQGLASNRPKLAEEPKRVPVSTWFPSDIRPHGPPVATCMDEWMSTTYNGMVSELDPIPSNVSSVEFVCKSFEMQFTLLLDHVAGVREVVFVRPCYEKLFDLLLKCITQEIKCVNVVVTGNPGVGKSRFYSYCVLRLAKAMLPEEEQLAAKGPLAMQKAPANDELHTEDEQLPGKETHTKRKTSIDEELLTEKEVMKGKILMINTAEKFSTLENGIFHEVKDYDLGFFQDNRDVIRLIDGSSSRLLSWPGLNILFASPGTDNNAKFRKSEGVEFIMPPWTYQELLMAARVMTLNEERVKERFLQFGGIARMVFAETSEQYEGQLNQAISEVDPSMLLRLVRLQTEVIADMYSHKLLHMLPQHKGREYQGFFLSFASPRIAHLIFKRLCESNYKCLKDFLLKKVNDPSSAVLRGAMFEEVCHHLWSDSGQHELTGRYLTNGTAFSVTVHDRPATFFFFELEQIPEFVPGVPIYCRPNAKRFPCIDAIYWDGTTCHLLQMTISDRHGIVLDHFVTILGWCEQRRFKMPVIFVFVVPEEKVQDYKVQKLLKNASTSQVVTAKNTDQSKVATATQNTGQSNVAAAAKKNRLGKLIAAENTGQSNVAAVAKKNRQGKVIAAENTGQSTVAAAAKKNRQGKVIAAENTGQTKVAAAAKKPRQGEVIASENTGLSKAVTANDIRQSVVGVKLAESLDEVQKHLASGGTNSFWRE